MVRRRLAGRALHNAVPLCPDLRLPQFPVATVAAAPRCDPHRIPAVARPTRSVPAIPNSPSLVTAPPPGAG